MMQRLKKLLDPNFVTGQIFCPIQGTGDKCLTPNRFCLLSKKAHPTDGEYEDG